MLSKVQSSPLNAFSMYLKCVSFYKSSGIVSKKLSKMFTD
jgi:hypothetical protein